MTATDRPVLPGRWVRIARRFTELGLPARAAGAQLHALLRDRLNFVRPMRTEDRRILEQVIFPHYGSDPAVRTVLFVGCAWYTAHYQRRYFARQDYWTIDPDATRRRFGAKQHIVVRLEQLGQYFQPAFFDLIICNGVYGWGLNRLEDCETAMGQCHRCLAEAGHLLLGWNDVPRCDPAPLSQVQSLSQFARYPFPAFGSWQYLTDTPIRHTYYFLQKRE